MLDRIGAGGMGVVYAAHDHDTRRTVAIKLSRPHADRQAWVTRARLLREAEALACVRHPNVVGYIDGGVECGVAWVAMQRLQATSLIGRALAPCEAVRIGLQIGAALGAVHDAGLVHRDVTPNNVLVGPCGHAWLIDFGLARAATPGRGDSFTDLALSGDGLAPGTPRYMAPEQRDGGVGVASDQFSLCATLLRGLVGTAASAGLLGVLTRGCAERPEARYPDMRAFVAALGRCA